MQLPYGSLQRHPGTRSGRAGSGKQPVSHGADAVTCAQNVHAVAWSLAGSIAHARLIGYWQLSPPPFAWRSKRGSRTDMASRIASRPVAALLPATSAEIVSVDGLPLYGVA